MLAMNNDGSGLSTSDWFKSSFCQTSACVEVKREGSFIAIRNSQRPEDILRYTADEWAAFTAGLQNGDFNHLLDR
jgi:hypothetical protein